MTKTITRWGDRMLGALLPAADASACVGDQAGYCVYRYHGCGGSRCYYYYQCGPYCEVRDGQGGPVISRQRRCC